MACPILDMIPINRMSYAVYVTNGMSYAVYVISGISYARYDTNKYIIIY